MTAPTIPIDRHFLKLISVSKPTYHAVCVSVCVRACGRACVGGCQEP